MLRYEKSVWINAPVERVWAFHERDDIFDLLNPPGENIQILSRKGKLHTGSRVEFKIPVAGPIHIRWLALHVAHEVNHHFVDEQIRGPFRYWKHEHIFEPETGGARLTDRVTFSLPLSPFNDWLFGGLAKMRLNKLFEHRHTVTKQYCERPFPVPAE
ncbi:MAG TPA: SRPBCC family protein [Bryobacteraceae bacterium]|nr:SRPBCC family protein [Bryobacteraceae bacterium]